MSPRRPDFVAAYTVWPALPWIATALDMFTIRPHFSRSMLRRAALEHRNDPRRFVVIVRSYSSIEYFRRSPSLEYPELFTRPVTGPTSSFTRRNASWTLDSSVTSRYTVMPGVPADSRASSVSLASASRVR